MGLTEIVERILSASDVGGFPPPMARWLGLYAGGWAQQLRGDRGQGADFDRVISSGSEPAILRTPKIKMREEQSFDSMRITGK